jgi:hypothetical protein
VNCFTPISPRLLDRRHDVRVGGAATDVAAHPFADLGLGQLGLSLRQILGDIARHAGAALAQHADGRTDLPRGTIAALESVVRDERFLQRMQIVAVGQPLDRRDRLPVVHHRQREARIDPAASHQYRAGAALAVIAALLGAGQREVLAQRVEQGRPRVQSHDARTAVDHEIDGLRHCRCLGGRLVGALRGRHGPGQEKCRRDGSRFQHRTSRDARMPIVELVHHCSSSLVGCGQVSSGRFTTIGVGVLRTTTQ